MFLLRSAKEAVPPHLHTAQAAKGGRRVAETAIGSRAKRVRCGQFLREGTITLAAAAAFPYLEGMEVHFTPEQQAQIAQIASKTGTVPERLVTNVVARYLGEEARFLAAVEKGIVAAERGEFIEEDEMDARLEAMFRA
jgi:predicted transcriptional regulator